MTVGTYLHRSTQGTINRKKKKHTLMLDISTREVRIGDVKSIAISRYYAF